MYIAASSWALAQALLNSNKGPGSSGKLEIRGYCWSLFHRVVIRVGFVLCKSANIYKAPETSQPIIKTTEGLFIVVV